MNTQYRKELYECFHDEMQQVDDDLARGKISEPEAREYRRNLTHNFEVDLRQLGRDHAL